MTLVECLSQLEWGGYSYPSYDGELKGPSAAENNQAQANADLAQQQAAAYQQQMSYYPQLMANQQQQFASQQQYQSWMEGEIQAVSGQQMGLAQQQIDLSKQALASQTEFAQKQLDLSTTALNAELGFQKQQMDMANTLMDHYNTEFAQQQSILKEITGTLAPIYAKGPNQYGFSPEEDKAFRDAISGQAQTLSSEATDYNAKLYQQAAAAAGQQFAAATGDVALPSGAMAAQNANIAGQAAGQQSAMQYDISKTAQQEQQGVTQAGYQQGYNEWLAAAQGLGGAAQVANPNAAGAIATTGLGQAGSALGSAYGSALTGTGMAAGTQAGGYQLGFGGLNSAGSLLGQGASSATSGGSALAQLANSFGGLGAVEGYGNMASSTGNAAAKSGASAFNMFDEINQQNQAASPLGILGGALGGLTNFAGLALFGA